MIMIRNEIGIGIGNEIENDSIYGIGIRTGFRIRNKIWILIRYIYDWI